MNNKKQTLTREKKSSWQKKLYTVYGILLALAVLGEALVLREYFKKKKNA